MRYRCIIAISAALALLAAGAACAQQLELPGLPTPAPQAQADAPVGPVELDRLLAPVALYPDPLLTDILAASTYPAQIVEAARFVAANPGLQGAELASQASGQNWDASIQALLSFPAVLRMLDADLQWTDQLGRAVSAQQADVLDAVQRLRLAAERAGNLRNGPDADVVNEGQNIAILPPSPQMVYTPSYDPGCVYGSGFDDSAAACDSAVNGIGWDDGIVLPFGFLQWGAWDWRRRAIRFDHAHDGDGAHGHDRDGNYWRHGAPRHGNLAGALNNPGHFNYAPPADAMMHAGGVARVPAPEHFHEAGRPGAVLRHDGGPHPQAAPPEHAPSIRGGFAGTVVHW